MNIYDIAEKANVSIATVSRVLNGTTKVSESTKERVMKAIEETGFVPNAFARGLTNKSIGLVGVLCPNFGDTFYSQAVSCIERMLREHEMNALLYCSGSTLEGKRQGLTELAGKNVDAIILIGTVFDDPENDYIADVAAKIPIFTVNSAMDLPNVYCVKCNERQAAANVISAFVDKGYQRPLFLYTRPNYGNLAKLEGCRDAMMQAGLNINGLQTYSLDKAEKQTEELVNRHLEKCRDDFDSMFASNDMLAVYASKALRRMGIDRPIVGFNNSSVASLVTPELTSVNNQLEKMCETAISNLMAVLGGEDAPKITLVQGEIVYRETF